MKNTGSAVRICNSRPGPHGPPSSSVHGILQARVLQWVAMPSFRSSSQPRDRTRVSHIAGGNLPSEPPGQPKKIEYFNCCHSGSGVLAQKCPLEGAVTSGPRRGHTWKGPCPLFSYKKGQMKTESIHKTFQPTIREFFWNSWVNYFYLRWSELQIVQDKRNGHLG